MCSGSHADDTTGPIGTIGITVTSVLFAVTAFLLLVRPLDVPPLGFDEGWVLSVARHWVEDGHYGQILDGKPVSAAMLNVGFPAVAPIALAFKLFGVGIWQGRLPSALFALASIWLMTRLARQLCGPRVALGTLAVLLFMTPIHPIFMGKQALGEIPALFYLLAGYNCLLSAWRRSASLLAVAAVLCGLALVTKMQLLPFFLLALFVPIGIDIARRRWNPVLWLTSFMAASALSFFLLRSVHEWIVQDRMFGDSTIFHVTAIVPALSIRVLALTATLLVALPTLLGLVHAARDIHRSDELPEFAHAPQLVLFILLLFSAGWILWYAALSAGWQRYLFPPIFVGSLFVARLLYRLTDGYRFSSTLHRCASTLRFRRSGMRSASAFLAFVLIIVWGSISVRLLLESYLSRADSSVIEVAHFINTSTSSSALIESFDMEVFFLINRRYHHPPDQTQLLLNRRFQDPDIPVDYDPIAADPDYLVVGPQSKLWHLYDSAVRANQFTPIRAYSLYSIYERTR
jgi:4-amino-4-deoxy-L-arabinose transferase-like glycosyltransferase